MFIYVAQNTPNGHDLSSKHQMIEVIGPTSCQPISRVVPVPALRAEIAAQAWHYHRALPCLDRVFSVVLGPAHRVSAIWKSIQTCET